MKKMVLLGGGRWARVLLSVLVDVLAEDWRILWVTQHGRQAAEIWCREQAANATRPGDWIEVVAEVSDAQLSRVQAAIVATSPHTHGDWLQRLLRAQVPTLCEKPLVLDPQQADELERRAIAANCPLGVNLELHYATYIERFARLVSSWDTPLATTATPAATLSSRSVPSHRPKLTNSQSRDMLDDAERRATVAQSTDMLDDAERRAIVAQSRDMLDDAERRATLVHRPQSGNSQARHVELQWLDPWSEVRYGETKYSDVYTNIVDDMFPHCWSLLRHVTGVEQWGVEQVDYLLNSDVQISLVQGDASANITISRRAPQRTRRLSVQLSAANLPAVLDFSPEPGVISRAGERHELQWGGERPLTRSLKSFLSVIDAHRSGDQQAWQSWPLSIVACRQSVQVSAAIARQLQRAQQHWLERCSAGDQVCAGAAGQAFRRRLWFDMFVPIAAAAGQRLEFTDPQQLQAFYDSIAQRSH